MAKGQSVASFVEEKLTPHIVGIGYRVWDVEFVKEGTEHYLRITIDSDDGITLDDCEKVHRLIDPILDELDPIDCSYHLEVSSPGIERELRKPWHYESAIGEKVEIRLFSPDESGKKSYTGKLIGFENGVAVISTDAGDKSFDISKIAKASTVFDF
ncbi:ribosome maturation factor RimP [Candidatus Apopatosoma intestinale]|jgi:ribosome maturation factor RimP|nr:ribosome maturation factor RimP [Candidatus Apopatosoma intestinale]